MTTTLNTEIKPHGVELSDDDGTVVFVLVYDRDYTYLDEPWRWFVARTDGEGITRRGWATQEAAGFYALALHAHAIEINRETNVERAGS